MDTKVRESGNMCLINIINLMLSIYPDLRYIQALWNLGIIDTHYIQNEGYYINDRFAEEPKETIIRILPRIYALIYDEFPEKSKASQRIYRSMILNYLRKELNINDKI